MPGRSGFRSSSKHLMFRDVYSLVTNSSFKLQELLREALSGSVFEAHVGFRTLALSANTLSEWKQILLVLQTIFVDIRFNF